MNEDEQRLRQRRQAPQDGIQAAGPTGSERRPSTYKSDARSRGEERHSAKLEGRGPRTEPDCALVRDQRFAEDVFVRNYEVQMGSLGGVCFLCIAVLLLNPMVMSEHTCLWPYAYIVIGTLPMGAVRALMHHHRRSIPSWGPEAFTYMVMGSHVVFTTICLASVASGYGSNISAAFDGHPERIWEVFATVWYAIIPASSMLQGVVNSTLNIPRGRLLLLSAYTQIGCFAAAMGIQSYTYDEKHTVRLALLCQLPQHVAYAAGVYLGSLLVRGQRAYFDQAESLSLEAQSLRRTLRERMLEQQVKSLSRDAERLHGEKERLEYERQMAIKFVMQGHAKDSDQSVSHVSYARTSSSSSISFQATRSDVLSDNNKQDQLLSTLEDDPATDADQLLCTPEDHLATDADAGTALAEHSLKPGMNLPRDVWFDDMQRGKMGITKSSDGWSDLSAELKKVVPLDYRPPKDSQQRPISKLNPNAAPWKAPAASTTTQPLQTDVIAPATPAAKPAGEGSAVVNAPPDLAERVPRLAANKSASQKAKARLRREEQLAREIEKAQAERKQMNLAPLDEETLVARCEACQNEHIIKMLLVRHPGELKIKLVTAGAPGAPGGHADIGND
jgi:hypothetical protein